MTQQIQTKNLELETACGLSFKAWNDAAKENGVSIKQPMDALDNGGYPRNIYDRLKRFRRVMALARSEPKKVVVSMHRQLVSERDPKGRPVKNEYLTWNGYYEVLDYGGNPYQADIEAGKYSKPKIINNSNRRFDPKTGEPQGEEKIFSGSTDVYTIPVPQSKTERKKLIDEIIGDNFPESILFYYRNDRSTGDIQAHRDSSFTYEEFWQDTIQEMESKSARGGGAKSPGYYVDPKDGKLRDKFGQTVSNTPNPKGAYQ